MLKEAVKSKIESRCGIVCSECEYKESMGCLGCTNIENPFHGECAVKKCAESKKIECCGECVDFPCGLLKSYAYDKEQGDNGLRIKNCCKWCHCEEKENEM